MKDQKKDSLIGISCALGCEIIYGLSYTFTKQATECASELALLGWRFFIAAVIMSLCVLSGIIRIDLKGKSIRPLLIVALCSPCVYFTAETVGISHTTASESGVILACIPVASMIASTLILKEKPAKMQVTGILITLAGVIITVFAVSASSSLSAPGYLFLMVAVVSYALYSVFVEKGSEYTGTEITYVMLLAGALFFVPLALAEAGFDGSVAELIRLPFTKAGFLTAVLYQGIFCSVLAFFLANCAIAKIGVNRTASFIGISTVVSILASTALLHEAFTGYQILGVIVIIAGVYTAQKL